jgi:hypothetical protein
MADWSQAQGYTTAEAEPVAQLIDSHGQTQAWQFAIIGDTTLPVVDNYSPAVGSTVNEADPIFFDVTDNSGEFASIVIAIKQGPATELVHDGSDFVPPYLDLSSRDNIADGFRYRIRRTDGWIDTVVQSAFVVDASGNVAA